MLPLGKAHIEREGTDVTLVTFSKMVGYCLDAAEELAAQGRLSAEVLNFRSLRPLDRDAIINSVKKTNRLVAVEEGWPQCGIAAEICAVVMESDAFDYLDAPVERVTGADVPMAYAIPSKRCLYRKSRTSSPRFLVRRSGRCTAWLRFRFPRPLPS